MHTKLHALLSCLEFQVGEDELSTDEKKKLMVTHHYVDDKDAILWRTVSKELGEEGIRPVTPVRPPPARAACARFSLKRSAVPWSRHACVVCAAMAIVLARGGR